MSWRAGWGFVVGAIASCELERPLNKRLIGCDWPPIRRRRFPCGRERPRMPYRAISPYNAQNSCSPSSHLARSSTSTPSRV